MKTFTSPVAGFAAGLVLAAALVLAVAPTPSGAQQEQPIVTGDDATQIAALSAQLTELQAKVDRMDSEKSTIRAPFVVLDDQGRQMFAVTVGEQGQPKLTLGWSGAAQTVIEMTGSGSIMRMISASGAVNVALEGRDEKAGLALRDGGMFAELGNRLDGTTGLTLIRGQPGGSSVNLIATDRSGEIHLFSTQGLTFAVANETAPVVLVSNGSGKPLFSVGTFENKPVMTLREEGSGRVQIGIAAQGNFPYVSLFDGTTERVSLEASAAPVISLQDTQGGEVFNVTGDNDPKLTVGRAEGLRTVIGTTADAAYLALRDAKGERVTVSGGTTTELTLFNNDAVSFFRAGGDPVKDEPVLTIGTATGSRVEMGVTKDASGSFTRWVDQAGAFRALIEVDSKATEISLHDIDGAEFFNVATGESLSPPLLSVGKPDKPRVLLGVAAEGAGAFASFYDTAADPAASIKAGAAQSMLELRDSNMIVRLGTVDETKSRLGLYLGKGDKTFVRVNIGGGGESGGEVAAYNGSGKPVAGLIAGDDGGDILVMGPQGGTAVAQVAGRGNGGEISVYAPTGDPRAHMESAADGTGIFSVMGQGGSIDMTSGEKAPRLVVQKEGRQFVYLGSTVDGEGVVKAGPGGNGVAGTLGSGLTAASSLQGKVE